MKRIAQLMVCVLLSGCALESGPGGLHIGDIVYLGNPRLTYELDSPAVMPIGYKVVGWQGQVVKLSDGPDVDRQDIFSVKRSSLS